MRGEAVLDDVLHRLDVVVGGALHRLDFSSVCRGKVGQKVLQELIGAGGQRGHLGYTCWVLGVKVRGSEYGV